MARREATMRVKAEPARRALPFLKPGASTDVFEQKNNGCVGTEENDGEEVNDFILCLGYLPSQAKEPVRSQKAEEEINDFILCLGYGSE